MTAESLEDVHPELFGIEVNKYRDSDVVPASGIRQIYKINTGLQSFDSEGDIIESGSKRDREQNPFARKQAEQVMRSC